MTNQAGLQTDLLAWMHRENIRRYRYLLTTPLTPVERRFIKRRLGEEEAALCVVDGQIGMAGNGPGAPVSGR